MPISKQYIDVDLYGCKGDGSTDDTVSMRRAIKEGISKKLPIMLGAKNYRVTDTILKETSKNNITIIGQGMDLSKITFATTNSTRPLIQLELCYYATFKDFTVTGTSKNGIGFKLGRYVSGATGEGKWNAVAYSNFEGIKAANFNVGIWHDAGWINTFTNCNVRDSATGMKMHGNDIKIYGLVSEANDIGVDMINDDQNSTVSFFGGCIEVNNQIGLKVRFAHDLNLYGVYFEDNPNGHIVAGVDPTDKIDAITIVGGSLHFPDPLIFDRVGALSISGLMEHKTPAPITITSNVQQYDIPQQFQHLFDTATSGDIEALNIEGLMQRQSDRPWYTNDFSIPTIAVGSTTTTQLDAVGNVTLSSDNLATFDPYTADYLSGTKSIKVSTPAGKTFCGARFNVNVRSVNSNYMCVKIPIKFSANITGLRIKVDVRYELNDSSTQTSTPFDYVPAMLTADYGAYKYLGKWMHFIVPVNLVPARSAANFRNLTEIRITIHGALGGAGAVGTEYFLVDSLDIYQSRYITNPYIGKTNFNTTLESTFSTVITDNVVLGGRRISYASSKPATGTYAIGDYVHNTAPAIVGGAVVLGWSRVTAGATHVLGTDWVEDRVSITSSGANSTYTLTSPSGLIYTLAVADNGTTSTTGLATAYDLFNRTDSSSTLGSADLGGAYTAVQGTWGISSNAAYSVTGANGDLAILPYSGGTELCTIRAKMKGAISNSTNYHRPSIIFRYVDNLNFMYVRLENSTLLLRKCDNGTHSTLASIANTNVNDTYFNVKIVNKTGNIVEVYYNDALVITHTMVTGDVTKYGTAKTVGLFLNIGGTPASTASWDQIIVEPTP